MDKETLRREAEALRTLYQRLRQTLSSVIVGQEEPLHFLTLSLFGRGHALLIGPPGVAKTLMVSSLAQAMGLTFHRIQFTPDLMPADILGTEVLQIDPETGQRYFRFMPGPVFAHIILADEINRASPKTQSALLEAMQERSVSISGQTHPLPDPFFVLATQNPIEQEGTYPLPEAQLDRFMFAIFVGYPSRDEEIEVVKRTTAVWEPSIEPMLSAEKIIHLQKLIRQMPVADNVVRYAVDLARSTRPQESKDTFIKENVSWGVGPRAAQFLLLAAKAHALLSGKYSPDVEDVQYVAVPVLRHRMVLSYQAEAEGISPEKIIRYLMEQKVPVV
ncbi:MAG: MoxR family ATPase [Bacteroidia bacterium]|nr:MoxR family ATPase [Bacteroidia bacterium]MCX7652020.1 MoxR family ATPase [Bacteroidia bacterium]MDW8416309.1 MoxR family ATPase [Bacteroidia bacterium]